MAHGATRHVRVCVGHPLTAKLAPTRLDHPRLRWVPALTADGTAERAGGEVAELTRWVDLTDGPPGTRLTGRREVPHSGAHLTFITVRGYRLAPDRAERGRPLPGCIRTADAAIWPGLSVNSTGV